MQEHSKFELNSFLTKLTEEWNEDAAQAVINAFYKLPKGSKCVSKNVYYNTGASAEGHTTEAGNVTVGGSETVITEKGENPGAVARVGHYKIRRHICEHGNPMIIWENFWKADYITRSIGQPPNPLFVLHYMLNSHEPLALTRYDYVRIDPEWYKLLFFNFKQRIVSFIKSLRGISRKYYYYSHKAIPTVIFKKE